MLGCFHIATVRFTSGEFFYFFPDFSDLLSKAKVHPDSNNSKVCSQVKRENSCLRVNQTGSRITFQAVDLFCVNVNENSTKTCGGSEDNTMMISS